MPIILQNNPLLSERIAMIWNHSDPNTDYSPSYDQDVLEDLGAKLIVHNDDCLLYTSPSPRDATLSRMPSSA